MYNLGYKIVMYKIYTTTLFDKWFANLKDKQVKTRIQIRIDRMEDGHLGDYKALGSGVFELRLFFDPGYRLYYCYKEQGIVVLLVGGDKSSQAIDIIFAKQLVREFIGNKNVN